jgi:hypothetical protein
MLAVSRSIVDLKPPHETSNPCVVPSGNYEDIVEATSVFDAVRQAIAIQETRSGPVPDETIVVVIQEGKTFERWNAREYNSLQPQWRVRVGRVRG